jgi:uncharacterized protein (TIGR00730 family)
VGEVYAKAAQEAARLLVERGCRVVYGGGKVGLMGVVAEAALAAGGHVTGVTTARLLEREVMHRGLSELHSVATMHERKSMMTRLADAFLILPGGYGTLDELFEVLTLQQLGVHNKQYGLLNVNGFFDGLIRFLDQSVCEGMLQRSNRDLLQVGADLPDLLTKIGAV